MKNLENKLVEIFQFLESLHKIYDVIYIHEFDNVGDNYILCKLSAEYENYKGTTNTVHLLPERSPIKMLQLLHINYQILDRDSINDIRLFYKLFPLEYICFLGLDDLRRSYRFFKNASAIEWYGAFIFNFNIEDCKKAMSAPDVYEISKATKETISKLPEGKVAVINNYANFCGNVSKGDKRLKEIDFWKKLCDYLRSCDYTVYTIVSPGNKNPIDKTAPLDFQLDQTKPILDKVDLLVALRSGFCDLSMRCNCNKLILYPSRKFEIGPTTFYSYFTLKEFGSNIEEYTYSDSFEFNDIVPILDKLINNTNSK